MASKESFQETNHVDTALFEFKVSDNPPPKSNGNGARKKNGNIRRIPNTPPDFKDVRVNRRRNPGGGGKSRGRTTRKPASRK